MGRKKRDLSVRREKESTIYHIATFLSLVGVVINPLSWFVLRILPLLGRKGGGGKDWGGGRSGGGGASGKWG